MPWRIGLAVERNGGLALLEENFEGVRDVGNVLLGLFGASVGNLHALGLAVAEMGFQPRQGSAAADTGIGDPGRLGIG